MKFHTKFVQQKQYEGKDQKKKEIRLVIRNIYLINEISVDIETP